MAWLCQSTSKGPSMANTMTSGPSTMKRRNTPWREYIVHMWQMCHKYKQEGHYARDCPRTTNQKSIKMKMGRMQAFLRLMMTTEWAKFKKHILGDEDKSQMKMPDISLSRETSPHTNWTFAGVLPSRETGPHISQVLRWLTKTLERCEECGREHLTHICIKRFRKLHKPELTVEQPMWPKTVTFNVLDDELIGSDTLCDSEESEDEKVLKPKNWPSRMTKRMHTWYTQHGWERHQTMCICPTGNPWT